MNKDLETALGAARAGAETVRYYRDNVRITLDSKGLHDLVTNADVETEKVILDYIKKIFPDDTILAEESSASQKMTDGRIWIIDPIDGTTNFAHNFPVYCVSVGLWDNRKPKAAAVIEVNRNEEFTAAAGEGAWLNAEPIQVSGCDDSHTALLATGFPYNDLSLLDDYLSLFRDLMQHVQGIRRPGAASFDLCCVAAGRFDGFFEYSLKAWDVAAAALIIQEAGGVVTDWNGEQNWLFGQRIITGNKGIHQYLFDKISEHVKKENRVK